MIGRRAAWVLAGPAALILGYALLAAVLGLIGVNRDFRPTALSDGGIRILVRSNGLHAELVLPTQLPGVDWSEEFPASHMRALAQPAPWIAFGWGDRDFMLTTPTWRDVRSGPSLVALSGLGRGAMHVEYVARAQGYDSAAVQISAEQYRRLVRGVRASFRRDKQGRPIRIDAPGYFDDDAFYEAVPVYSVWFTCNEWVRRLLSDAGLPAPAWAPFERTLFWHLPRAPHPPA